ncbi:cellulase family glycosylhydrolase [Microbacterium betulae]|uniref:Cellulase family glycosylhydrolase n=1 Tax=Microbacterium betulae TaxID=2981139 RepID=A0AA97FG80_9MICO|nr:cellulase family glycosylhydrolase [Microbacterium sp. AB]WOF22318.1 cellulase family glycosylhydrolase [Microbacterium sp. AB]
MTGGRAGRRPSADAGVLVVAAVLVVGALALGLLAASPADREAQVNDPSPSAEEDPSAQESASPQDAAAPASAPVDGAVEGWRTASQTVVADVRPEVGDARDGDVSVAIDAPVVERATTALSTTVEVVPGETYRVSLSARTATASAADVAAALEVDSTRIGFPALSSGWAAVTGTFTAEPGQTRADVRLRLLGPVEGLSIDEISMTPQGGGADVVVDGSFERVRSRTGIVNDTLILPEAAPVLAVRMAEGDATWRVRRAGETVAKGTATLRDGVTPVALDGAPQGYLTVTVTDADGAEASASLAVVDLAGARPVSDGRFGIAAHLLADSNTGAADAIRAVGFGAARHSVTWSASEYEPGVYLFPDEVTRQFDVLASHGIGLLGIVNYENSLYDDGRTPSSPEAVEAFGRYAGVVANRYDVIGLEVFNEFDSLRFNSGECGAEARCYALLVRAAAEGVRAIDPDLPVVVGGISTYDGDWLEELWRGGAIDDTDIVSFHPYNAWDAPERIAGYLADARERMREITGETRPIWLTELGWTTGDERGEGLSLWDQAAYLVRAETTALGSGADRVFWYDLVNDSADDDLHEGNFGLFSQREDGASALRPKPAAFAQTLLIEAIGGRDAAGRDDLAGGAHSYRFGAGDDVVRVAWSTSGTRKATFPSATDVIVTTLRGEVSRVTPEDGRVTVSLTDSPVVIEASDGGDPSSSPSPEAAPEDDRVARPEAGTRVSHSWFRRVRGCPTRRTVRRTRP